MKLRYLIIFVFMVCTCAGAEEDLSIRVRATGLASPGVPPGSRARAAAFRAAKVQGYKKLAEAAGFSKIHQTGKNTQIEVNAFLKGARVITKKYISDYEVEVVMEIDKRDIYHSTINRLKMEIKTTEAKISALNRRLQELKTMVQNLEGKIKNQDNR